MNECPKCGSDEVREILCAKRMVRYSCRDCYWEGPIRVPKKEPIRAVKFVEVDQFGGHIFETYDRYGQTMCHSRTYYSRPALMKELEKEMRQHDRPKEEGGPFTALVWPAKVKVKADKFKFKKGKLVKV